MLSKTADLAYYDGCCTSSGYWIPITVVVVVAVVATEVAFVFTSKIFSASSSGARRVVCNLLLTIHFCSKPQKLPHTKQLQQKQNHNNGTS